MRWASMIYYDTSQCGYYNYYVCFHLSTIPPLTKSEYYILTKHYAYTHAMPTRWAIRELAYIYIMLLRQRKE